jgi:hypothetical protein
VGKNINSAELIFAETKTEMLEAFVGYFCMLDLNPAQISAISKMIENICGPSWKLVASPLVPEVSPSIIRSSELGSVWKVRVESRFLDGRKVDTAQISKILGAHESVTIERNFFGEAYFAVASHLIFKTSIATLAKEDIFLKFDEAGLLTVTWKGVENDGMCEVVIPRASVARFESAVWFAKNLHILYDSNPLAKAVFFSHSVEAKRVIVHPDRDVDILFVASEADIPRVQAEVERYRWTPIAAKSEIHTTIAKEVCCAFNLKMFSHEEYLYVRNETTVSFSLPDSSGPATAAIRVYRLSEQIEAMESVGSIPIVYALLSVPDEYFYEKHLSEIKFCLIESLFDHFIKVSPEAAAFGMKQCVLASHPNLREMLASVHVCSLTKSGCKMKFPAYSIDFVSSVLKHTFLPKAEPLQIIPSISTTDDFPLRCLMFGDIPDRAMYINGDALWRGGKDANTVISEAAAESNYAGCPHDPPMSKFCSNEKDPISLESFEDDLSFIEQYKVIICDETHGYCLSSLVGLNQRDETPLYPLTRRAALGLKYANACVEGLLPHRKRQGLLAALVAGALRDKQVDCSITEVNLSPFKDAKVAIELTPRGIASEPSPTVSTSPSLPSSEASEASSAISDVSVFNKGPAIAVVVTINDTSVLSFCISKEIAKSKIFEEIGNFRSLFETSILPSEELSRCFEELTAQAERKQSRGWFVPAWRIAHPATILQTSRGEISESTSSSALANPTSAENIFVTAWFANED